jgi:hypothetical protein
MRDVLLQFSQILEQTGGEEFLPKISPIHFYIQDGLEYVL